MKAKLARMRGIVNETRGFIVGAHLKCPIETQKPCCPADPSNRSTLVLGSRIRPRTSAAHLGVVENCAHNFCRGAFDYRCDIGIPTCSLFLFLELNDTTFYIISGKLRSLWRKAEWRRTGRCWPRNLRPNTHLLVSRYFSFMFAMLLYTSYT